MVSCRGCGIAFAGRPSRVYCSLHCQREYERKARIELWLRTGQAYAGSRTGHYVRTYIAREQDYKCALCSIADMWNGKPLIFVLDHVDGDSTNNERVNLRLICPNCDSQLPPYKNRHLGRGRFARRQRYANGQSY